MKTARQTAAGRRLSLLQAALELFSTHGYDGTTTRAIAQRVGVTEALVFKHFRTKRELLRAVVAEFGPRRMFPPPPPSLQTIPARAALETFITQYLDTFWANRAFLRMLLMATDRDRAALEELRAQFWTLALSLHALLQERAARGELRPDSAVAATDVISASTSGFLQRSLSEEPEDWAAARSQFVAHLLQTLFDGLQEKKESSDGEFS